MTVSFTKEEVDWLISLLNASINVADIQEEDFDVYKDIIEARDGLLDKIKQAKIKDELKKCPRR